jgi:hypothetical protein
MSKPLTFTQCCLYGFFPEAREAYAAAAAAGSPITAQMVRAHGNELLRSAYINNRLDLADWLVGTFGLTAEDASAENHYAFRWACRNGHLSAAKALAERFALDEISTKNRNIQAMEWAHRFGREDVTQWLAEQISTPA